MKDCCKIQANREKSVQLNDDLVVSMCRCGAKHFEMTADPLELSLEIKPIGETE
jgi:hypothetical protein